MAARMTGTSRRRKEQLLDVLKDNFVDNTNAYVSAVKEAIRDEKPQTAAKIFQVAVNFLSQDLPDPTCQASDSQSRHFEGDNTEEMEALKVRIDDLEKQVQAQEQKLEAQKNCSFLELQVSTSVDSLMNRVLRLNRKLDSLKLNMQVRDSETRESLKDLSEISKENVNALKGLRKFQNLLQQKTQASISRPLKEARERKNFELFFGTEPKRLVNDAKLLLDLRLVVAESTNISLFSAQMGNSLRTMKCESRPCHLAVIDSSDTSNTHTVAVTMDLCKRIDILEIANDMKVKRTLQTSRQYSAVAAVNKQSLAVGYSQGPGIDLINLDGHVLRQILPQIATPVAVAITSDGSLLVTDHTTLHLVSSQGVWTKQLWSMQNFGDAVMSVSMHESCCFCVTHKGYVYMLDCLY